MAWKPDVPENSADVREPVLHSAARSFGGTWRGAGMFDHWALGKHAPTGLD